MNTYKWKYYNHAMIPDAAPHEEADVSYIENGEIWKNKNKPFLARFTTDFDCGFETNWWYVIKDDVFDIDKIKAKHRYEINKGIKYFDVKRIDTSMYKEDMYAVTVEAFKGYPKKYRPNINKDSFIKSISDYEKKGVVYGAFSKENGFFCGYAYVKKIENCFQFSVLKTNPIYEKYNINAALVYYLVKDLEEDVQNGCYICDGERNISHETRFQDYLQKYFGFRKAYCKLNIVYNPKIKPLIKMIYHIRNIIKKFDFVGIVHSVNAVMKMEEISRSKK